MSTAPAPEPRDPKDAKPRQDAKKPANALIFDDPLAQQSADDTDRGWGERPTSSGDSAADLARFLDEKPPHHI
ncbi:hypothetical protein ACFWZT_08970 [Streptomyces alboflavus]|mgnify:CR=1 FL=1|uniref:Uncharacterized protein n=1 Tax=Streptomyces alboflavus TaxID=67267 RepID=A0A1Z1WCL7_9ACTN|nr:hypothetical protein [Streptomyces alboflavus]ARX84129.1 hypothetical protein SMD44_03565 [Streptomyces alboflavus]